jgi:YVTN family beta-propeller protein
MKKTLFSLFRPAAVLAGAALLFAATGCDPDDDAPAPSVTTTTGVYVVNEGTNSGSISLFDKATKAVTRDLYGPANGRQLGPYLQNMTIVGDYAYLVVNGADSVQVVRLRDFKRVAGIGGLSQPRYLVASGSKGYLTQWQGGFGAYTAGKVAVLNLATNTVTKDIAVGVNPEQMLLTDNKLYVTNSEGNTVTVINTTTETVESTIAVPEGPKNILRDGSGNIWLLCSKYGASQDYLVRFAPATPTQQTRIAFPNDYTNGNLRSNKAGDKIYVSLGTGTYELTPTATALPATPLIRRNFYGLGIDPQDNTIYGGTATFTGNAKVIRYTVTGAPIDSFDVGVGPNSFLFR